ncbi:MAG: hypothetical protein ACTSU2_03625 [Promethearchaeota archaeon]
MPIEIYKNEYFHKENMKSRGNNEQDENGRELKRQKGIISCYCSNCDP